MEARGNVEGQQGREEMTDVVQMRLVLAGCLEEMAGLGFGPCSSSQSHSLGLDKHGLLTAQGI